MAHSTDRFRSLSRLEQTVLSVLFVCISLKLFLGTLSGVSVLLPVVLVIPVIIGIVLLPVSLLGIIRSIIITLLPRPIPQGLKPPIA